MTATPMPVPLPVDFGPTFTDWAMVWITAVGVVATLLIGFLTLLANRRARIANARAQDAQIRIISESLERTARSGQDAGVRWDVIKTGKAYELRNVGDATALHTTLRELETEGVPQDLYVQADGPFDVAPRAGIPFTIERSIVSPAVTGALIEWRDEAGDEHREQRLIR